MNPSKKIILLLVFFLIVEFIFIYPAHSFSSTNVPVTNRVYLNLNKLEAFGLIKTAIHGQRPWSRNEIARLIHEADRHLLSLCQNEENNNLINSCPIAARLIINRLKKEYHEDLVQRGVIDGTKKNVRFHYFEHVNFEYLFLDSPPRNIPVNNGVGFIDGFVNPLIEYSDGLDFADGNTLSLETNLRLNLSKYLAFYFRPNMRILIPNTGNTKPQFIIQNLYGKFQYKKFAVLIGRDNLIWGQAREGGLLFSNNARAQDMIKISNDNPFRFPWIFKFLGPSKITFFVSNLGPERVYKDAFLYGIKLSIKPAPFIELGISETIVMGGKGAPSVSFIDPLIELIPIFKIGRNTQFADISDHRFGFFDARFRIPPLRNTSIYFESYFEDSPGRAIVNITNIWEQMAFMVGVNIPLLRKDGSLDLTVEYRHMPGWAYRHSNWTTGYTLNREIIGDPLGPDADSLRLIANIDINKRNYLEIFLAYERRGSDLFSQTTNPKTGGFEKVFRSQHNPTEYRYRLIVTWKQQVNLWLSVQPQLGYEHVTSFNFQPGSNRQNFLAGFQLVFTR